MLLFYTDPTVALFIEDLRGQWDAIGGFLLLWDILPHPLAVLFIAGNVQLSVVHLQCFQEAQHILLLLFDLELEETNSLSLTQRTRGPVQYGKKKKRFTVLRIYFRAETQSMVVVQGSLLYYYLFQQLVYLLYR